ncbi:hypothetical protein BGW38_006734 [Lunasporangiospora selenospora]|uniref:3-oxo-5-alpha-steroid 4-dehydrogenase C-terminal domain-containing protein n=1 Tax=Lunasporangiospora selenospora TaxID=979761 RepID=A0A9P6FM87_9FUNG|nr:hypothetical protein BGW38_006734 [Lunasporangiospora selenospora]
MDKITSARSIEELLIQWDPYIPRLSFLIRSYFILIITLAILAATLPPLRNSILTYGKLDANTVAQPSATTCESSSKSSPTGPLDVSAPPKDPQSQSSLLALVYSIRVPKTWFAHFYVFATLWTLYLSFDLFYYLGSSNSRYAGADSRNTYFSMLDTTLGSTHSYWSILILLRQLRIMPSSALGTTFNPSASAGPFSQEQSSELLSGALSLPTEVLVAMACYQLHVIRRWYESWFLERPSAKATIHLGHYLVGISFYGAIAPSLWIDHVESLLSSSSEPSSSWSGRIRATGVDADWSKNWFLGFCVGLFLWASWHQFQCHHILANLRITPTTALDKKEDRSGEKEKASTSHYKVPFGDWFEYLVTPHYSAEMVLYFALFLMTAAQSISSTVLHSPTSFLETIGSLTFWIQPSLEWVPTMLLAWMWVVVNLGIIARETDQWYRAQFGDQYFAPSSSTSTDATGRSPQSSANHPRRILIPFVY